MRIYIYGRSTKAASNIEDAEIEFNGDTTDANYRRQFQESYGSSSTFFEGADNNTISARLPAASSPANSPGVYRFDIPYYADTTFNKIVFGQGAMRYDNSSLHLLALSHFMEWENTAAIDQIDLKLPSGNWVTGTKISLYGIT